MAANLISSIYDMPEIEVSEDLEASLYKSFMVAMNPKKYISMSNCDVSQGG